MTETLTRLSDELGDIVSFSDSELQAARCDKSGHVSDSAPLGIVHATSIDDVQRTLRFATATGTPVVTRGAGTGLAGGATASGGELVLSTLKMNRILEVALDDELAVVEAGVINGDLNRHLEPTGLWFAPDPASRAISTIGGNLATNAGGLLCAKYGVTRESVLGVKAVLADGRVMDFGHRTVKGVTGLDVAGLMIGSEGTLGVIVEATLRLQSAPHGVAATIGAWFATIEDAARAASVITASGIRPSIMELLDAHAMEAISAHVGIDVRPGQPFLLVQTDGHGAMVGAEQAVSIIRSLGGDAEITTDPAESARLFGMRRAFHPSMESRGTVLIEDVCVPRSALPSMFHAITEISARHGVDIATVAHAGDGNLHPNFVFQGRDVPPEVWNAAHDMFQAALRLGGTLTGEHGVGLLKRRWLGDELGDEQVELQRSIKRVFDPEGILNPGKVF